MIEGYSGTFTMYNAETGIFNPPDSEKTYAWPADRIDNSNYLVNDWNTWMRAFAYWLRDKFDFTIHSGPGTSVGKVGYIDNSGMGSGDRIADISESQYDNDWTNDNEDYCGRYETDDLNWEKYRAPSPFRPTIENGENYYTDGTKDENDNYVWTGKWLGNEIFDDHNNRFDIILEHPDFDNLGLRFKYPLTTTNTRGYNSGNKNNGSRCDIFITPSYFPVLDKQQIAFLNNCNGEMKDYGYSGFIRFVAKVTNCTVQTFYANAYKGNAILRNGKYDWGDGTRPQEPSYAHQYWYDNLTYADNTTTEPYPWTPDYLRHVRDSSWLFPAISFGLNTIYYKKSLDNKTLYIAVGGSYYSKNLEFVIYKNLDNSSGLLMPDRPYSRNSSRYWTSSSGIAYWNYTTNASDSRKYGNIAGLAVSSNSGQDFTNYIVTPTKYYKDIRDSNYSLIDSTGLWRLENLCPIPNSLTFCQNLFLVTRAGTGTEDPIGWEGKKILGKINNKTTKFLVFPFNNGAIGENDFNDCSTLFAIPIEQEE